MDKKLVYLVVAATAILHDGKRYETGDKIELTEAEAENLSLYVQLDEVEKQKTEREIAEKQAEKERLAAEQAQKEAEAKAKAEAEAKAKKEAEKAAKQDKA